MDFIDLDKVKNVNDIKGRWLFKNGKIADNYVWSSKYEKNIYLENMETKEKIKGLKNIIEYLKNNNLDLGIKNIEWAYNRLVKEN